MEDFIRGSPQTLFLPCPCTDMCSATAECRLSSVSASISRDCMAHCCCQAMSSSLQSISQISNIEALFVQQNARLSRHQQDKPSKPSEDPHMLTLAQVNLSMQACNNPKSHTELVESLCLHTPIMCPYAATYAPHPTSPHNPGPQKTISLSPQKTRLPLPQSTIHPIQSIHIIRPLSQKRLEACTEERFLTPLLFRTSQNTSDGVWGKCGDRLD
jgi:hypothetical protein